MASKPVDAAHHHRMIDFHARKLREMAGKGGSAAARGARMATDGTKPRTDMRRDSSKKK
jgi:hypothetical protein